MLPAVESGGSRQQGVTPSSEFEEEEVGPTRQRDSLVGQQFGEYVVQDRLGEGAMGIVYRGVQPLIGRPVAIKVLKPGFDDAGELLEEARAVSAARHPNIIDVFSFGETPQGQKYFVMELLSGEALDLWLRERTLSPLEVVGILKQLLSGLATAHAANVVHRDLKPGNLFMARLADGSHFLKILDFGLAKRVDPLAPEQTIGRMAGTPLYMAPEQARGATTGPFTDLYAVGCIAFELLSGRPPFSAPSVAELLIMHQSSPPPSLAAGLPPLLEELVRDLMEKDPARRPPSALAARQVLERVERRLLAASGTNTAHPSQGAMPATEAPPLARPRREQRRSVKDQPPSEPRPTLAEARPTVVARELSLFDEEDHSAPTANEMQPLVREEKKRGWLLALVPVPLLLVVALVWLLRPTPVEDLPLEAPEQTAAGPVPGIEIPEPEPVVAEPVPRAPGPTPPVPVVEAPPRAMPEPTRAPQRSGATVQARLDTLEERCLLELVDGRQRMALQDLRELRAELATASTQEASNQLAAFEAQWLKRPRR